MKNILNMENLMIFLVCALGGVALYMVITNLMKIPAQKSVDIMLKAAQGNKKEIPFASLSKKFAKHIKMDTSKKEKLERALELMQDTQSAEEFMAQKYIMAVIISLIFSILFFVSKPLGVIGILFGPIVSYLQYQEVFKKLKNHRAAVEREVPRFTQSVYENLKVSRNVLAIMESYQTVAGTAFSFELQKTIADMKTSNYESALMRLDRRIGSQPLSEVIRGLIGTLRGNDQTTYFDHLSFEMKHLEENMIRKEAMKRPEQMQRLSMAMLIGVFLMLAAVCGTMLVESFKIFDMV